jgi:DNA polymerase-3 subunit gamma/tau
MSYVVLARKHRPQNFSDVIGQEHITDILKSSIKSDRVAHAYLFCGPRGVGKTTCARILSMCLNCEDGPKIDPPLDSSICQEIAKGTSFDVIEIDGASNRGIDEIRTIRENVKFAPSYGRFKIYIVDEVHMLTSEAFNALLKTLEEPPEHVKFIFATTNPNKLPSTIISRCQRFDFKRIPLKTIVSTLSAVSEKEKLQIDEQALYGVAKAAKGSMRDALSILDQLSALSEKGIKSEDVFSMLGLVETEYLFELTDALAQKNCSEALKVLENIIDRGKDVSQLVKDLAEHFRNLMVIKIGGKSLGKLVDYPVSIKEMYLKQSELFELADILNAIDLFIEAQETARITESMRMALEVAVAKLTYGISSNAAQSQSTATSSSASEPAASKFSPMNVMQNNKGQVDISGSKPRTAPVSAAVQPKVKTESAPAPDVSIEISGEIDIDKIKRCWDSLTSAVSREKISVATFLQEGAPLEFDKDMLTIGFPKSASFQKEILEGSANLKTVSTIFSKALKMEIGVKYKIVDDYEPQAEDDAVQEVLNTFQGTVVNRWHNEEKK